jgi:hypothetical protein
VLRRYGELSEAEIDLTVCYVSVTSESLQRISYYDVLDKFLISSSHGSRVGPNLQEVSADEELSLGENEELSGREEPGDELI